MGNILFGLEGFGEEASVEAVVELLEALDLMKPSKKAGSTKTRGEEHLALDARREREISRPEDLGLRRPSGQPRPPPRKRVRT